MLKRLILLFALLLSACAPFADSVQAAIAQTQFGLTKYADCHSNLNAIENDPKLYYGRTVCVVGLIDYENKTTEPNSVATLYIAHFSFMQPGLELISMGIDVFTSVDTCMIAWGKVVPYKSTSFVNPAIYVYVRSDTNVTRIKEVPQNVCAKLNP